MTLMEVLVVLLVVGVMTGIIPWFLKASEFQLFSPTRTEKFIRPDPDCCMCHGEGCYIHPAARIRVDCALGCNEPKPQQVVHYRVLDHIENLGTRMGMSDEDARKFMQDFEKLVNSYLGPPIPVFVRVSNKTA